MYTFYNLVALELKKLEYQLYLHDAVTLTGCLAKHAIKITSWQRILLTCIQS